MSGVIGTGELAPDINLCDIDTGEVVVDPWTGGPTIIAFFKVTCPVCKMAAPKIAALAESGARVVAVGEDPAPALSTFRDQFDQRVPTVSEPAPYDVSEAYGVRSVPSLVLVGPDGVVVGAAGAWDREKWNAMSQAAGGGPVSDESDGLPIFRPG